MSTGQCRKIYSKFDVVDAITEIMDVMNFKASELGIKMVSKFDLTC